MIISAKYHPGGVLTDARTPDRSFALNLDAPGELARYLA